MRVLQLACWRVTAPRVKVHYAPSIMTSKPFRCFSTLPSHSMISMPALSPTMERGVIASWSISEGDAIVTGTPICEIETDKATVDFEAQDDGFLARILVDSGNEVAVGSPIGVFVEEQIDVAAFAGVSRESLGLADEPVVAEKAPENDNSKKTNSSEKIIVPSSTEVIPEKDVKVNTPSEQPVRPSQKKKTAIDTAVDIKSTRTENIAATADNIRKPVCYPSMKSPLESLLKEKMKDYENMYGHTLMRRRDVD